VALVKYCNQKLNEIESKVELLVKDREGRLQLKSLNSIADAEKEENEDS
jgi:exonuclease VII small subunit